MPRTFEMNWEGAPNYRWVKMYRGRRYRVSCDELGCPRTKEDSFQQANNWWRERRDQASQPVLSDEQLETLEDLNHKLEYAAADSPDLLGDLQQAKFTVLQGSGDEFARPDDRTIAENLELARLFGIQVPADLDRAVIEQFFGNRRLWQERLSRFKRVERDKTVGKNLNDFLAEQKRQQRPATYDELQSYFERLLLAGKVMSRNSDASRINQSTVAAHYAWLSDQGYASGPHNKYLGFFRRFVTWLWQNNVIAEQPRNLRLKSHRKKRVHQEVRRFEHVDQQLAALPEKQQLWALLALNCGMTPADLGETGWEQIDTTNWTLTRRRAKTKDHPNVPTVTYKLFPETVTLLKRLPHRSGLLFKTKQGRPMYERKYVEKNGKTSVSSKDNFTSYWNKLVPKPAITLGRFRSIASTALKEDKIYRQFENYFLAHAPRSLAEQHYGAEADAPFFEALEHLRQTVLKPKGALARSGHQNARSPSSRR